MRRLLILFLFFPLFVFAENNTSHLTLMLDWQLNPDHASLWIAQHKGFFAKQNLDVDLIAPSDSTNPARFAAAKQVDLGITYEPDWLIEKSKGLDVDWAATLVGRPLTAVMTSEKIQNISQLQGKTVGYSGGILQSISLRTMFRHEHLDSSKITWLNIHYGGLQALVAGRIDALTGIMRNVEPIELQQKGFAYHLFYPEDYGVPSYAELIIVTAPNRLTPTQLRGFQEAVKEATAYVKKYPEESWQLFANANPDLNNETNHIIWKGTVKYFSDHPGQFDDAQYQKLKTYLIQEKMLQ